MLRKDLLVRRGQWLLVRCACLAGDVCAEQDRAAGTSLMFFCKLP